MATIKIRKYKKVYPLELTLFWWRISVPLAIRDSHFLPQNPRDESNQNVRFRTVKCSKSDN